MRALFRSLMAAAMITAAAAATTPGAGLADTAAEIDREVDQALAELYAQSAGAKALGDKAEAVLVFPEIIKAGLLIGGQYGEGALRRNGKTVGYYSSGGASIGLTAGAQTYGYAMFLMSDSAVKYLEESDGWEIGSGPSVVVLDKGAAAELTTTTLKDDVYALVFDQEGLMLDISLEGSKIDRITPDQ